MDNPHPRRLRGVFMLILSRYISETIRIGDDVSIKVLDVKGNQVRIGIDAPQEVEVHREEIYRRIQRERMLTEQPTKESIKEPEVVVEGASYYSSTTEGGLSATTPTKAPNVIIKKKRAFSLV